MRARPSSNEATEPDDGLEAALAEWRAKPRVFFEDFLGLRMWSKQIEIAERVRDNPITAAKSCNGAGKTFTAAAVGLWFTSAFQPSIVITTAPTNRQVEGILWREIALMYQRSRYQVGGRLLTQELKFAPNWWMWGFTAPANDPNRFKGWHEENILVIVDEAPGVSPQIFDAIDQVLTSRNARLLMIGNPTDPSTRFAAAFRNPAAAKVSITAYETPNLTAFDITEADMADPSGRAIARKQKGRDLPYPGLITPAFIHQKFHHDWKPGSAFYQSMILAEFPLEGENTLIPMAWVERAQRKQIEPQGRGEFGCDMARYGSSETVIMHRRGGHFRVLYADASTSGPERYGRVRMAILDNLPERVSIDEPGIGGDTLDALVIDESLRHTAIVGINVGQPSQDDKFRDLRAEAFWTLRGMFERDEVDLDPADDLLASQLTSIKYMFRSGKLVVESKEDMRKRQMPSPDRADAAMLAVAAGLTVVNFESDAWVGPPLRSAEEASRLSAGDDRSDIYDR